MKISVIIPVYNTERYLEECLDSVIAQTFEAWECLLIDDGSSDRSGSICDRYAESDFRFKVFHTANSGVSAARNLGIEHASGSCIAFIDSDDTVDPGYLSVLHTSMVQDDVDLAVCGMKLIRPVGVEINESEEGVFPINREHADRFVDLNRKFLLYAPFVKLYCADIIREKNIRFPSGIHYGEDLIFNFKYLEHVTTLAVVKAPYYNYRMASGGTLSTSVHSLEFQNNYDQWNIIRSFFERRGIDSPSAGMFLSDRLWGLAYDLTMGQKLSLKEVRHVFSARFINDLRTFYTYSIPIPGWLKIAISNRLSWLIWMIQRRPVKK